MKKIVYYIMAGLFVLSITSCHNQRMEIKKKPRVTKRKEIKYYRDTPEYKRQEEAYKRCKDPSKCPEKFERNERKW